jgi:aspartate/glutamate racemase
VERSVTRVGLLHTVPTLAATFDAMIAERSPELERVHVSDAWLLQTAIREGVTDAVRTSVAQHLEHLVASGAEAILVTCSSIGEAAEDAAAAMDVPVVRVDAAIAADAVALAIVAGASRASGSAAIAVLATNTATLGPTGRLIQRDVDRAGTDITVTASVVAGAVAAREAGDPNEHDRLIAESVKAAADSADVIVLAQASMAAAAERADALIPVLTSPRTGVDSLLAAASLDGGIG